MPEPVCFKCGSPVAPAARFCSNCGAKMADPETCSQCGARLFPGDRFCTNCGQKVPTASAGQEISPPRSIPRRQAAGGPSPALREFLAPAASRANIAEIKLRGRPISAWERHFRFLRVPKADRTTSQQRPRFAAAAPARDRSAEETDSRLPPFAHPFPDPDRASEDDATSLMKLRHFKDGAELEYALGEIAQGILWYGNDEYFYALVTGGELGVTIDLANPMVDILVTDRPYKGSDGQTHRPPQLVFCGGFVLALSVAAAAMARFMADRDAVALGKTFARFGSPDFFVVQNERTSLSLDAAGNLLPLALGNAQVDDALKDRAWYLRFAAFMHVMAHGVGHLVKKHACVSGTRLARETLYLEDVEADVFAEFLLTRCFPQLILNYRSDCRFPAKLMAKAVQAWQHALLAKTCGEETANSAYHLPREGFTHADVISGDDPDQAKKEFGLDRAVRMSMIPPESQGS